MLVSYADMKLANGLNEKKKERMPVFSVQMPKMKEDTEYQIIENGLNAQNIKNSILEHSVD